MSVSTVFIIVRWSGIQGKFDKVALVCAGAGFSLVFAETIILAIVLLLVNAGEY